MPDGWAYVNDRDAQYSLPRLAEQQFPGYTFIRAESIATGLWRDVLMRTPDGRIVSRRLFF